MPEIREMRSTEYEFLKEMLYEAVFIPKGKAPLPRDVVNEAHLSKYIDNFGKLGDRAFVLADGDELVGAVWARQFSADVPGYGFVDDHTPELSIALKPKFRDQGFGTQMIEALVSKLTSNGITKVSLSVDRRSPAKELYLRLGFATVFEIGNATTMVKNLQAAIN